MINIEPIEYTSLDEIKNNFEFYKQKFINESVIVFRNANLSLEEQKVFHDSLGNMFGWFGWNDINTHYRENHNKNENMGKTGPDEIMLLWHVEHWYYANPIVAGTWNMFHLKTNPGAGRTYFIDTSVVYDLLEEHEKHFLNNCILKTDEFQSKSSFSGNDYRVISKHWLTDKPVIRISLIKHITPEISYVDYKLPTEEDYNTFKKITHKVIDIIETDESIRMVHNWKQGDLVFMDGFKLAHAVTGGFDSKDREFFGMWGHRYPFKQPE